MYTCHIKVFSEEGSFVAYMIHTYILSFETAWRAAGISRWKVNILSIKKVLNSLSRKF